MYYTLTFQTLAGDVTNIIKVDGENMTTFLPVDGTPEYEAYKAWLAEGNKPKPFKPSVTE